MSENSERKGMKWARWYAEKQAFALGDGSPDDEDVELRWNDERRALVRAALTGLVAQDITCEETALTAARQADAVLARYDEEVRGE